MKQATETTEVKLTRQGVRDLGNRGRRQPRNAPFCFHDWVFKMDGYPEDPYYHQCRKCQAVRA